MNNAAVSLWESLSEAEKERQLKETHKLVHENIVKAAQRLQKNRKKQQDWPQLQPLMSVLIRDEEQQYTRRGVIAVAYTSATCVKSQVLLFSPFNSFFKGMTFFFFKQMARFNFHSLVSLEQI